MPHSRIVPSAAIQNARTRPRLRRQDDRPGKGPRGHGFPGLGPGPRGGRAMIRILRLLGLPLVLAAACASKSPSAAPAPSAHADAESAPLRAPENPPDVRARMPLRPTPPQPETKFPPPQLSDATRTRAPPPRPSSSRDGDGRAPGRRAVPREEDLRPEVPGGPADPLRRGRRRRARETAARSIPGTISRRPSASSSRGTGSSWRPGSTKAPSASPARA